MNQDKKFRHYINVALSRLPAGVLFTLTDKKLILPLYHLVSDERVAHFIHLAPYATVKKFEQDLDFFQKNFNSISLDDLLQHLNNGRKIMKRSFLLSFDDGFREIYEIVAPILKRRSIPAVFFINSAFIDNKEIFFRNKISLILEKLMDPDCMRFSKQIKTLLGLKGEIADIRPSILELNYPKKLVIDEIARIIDLDFDKYLREQKPYMTTAQIKSLIDQGFTIGSHSIDHPTYFEIPLEEQLRQTRQSIQSLKESFHVDCRAFAFPGTDRGVSQEFFKLAKEYFEVSFGTQNFARGKYYNNFQRQPMERGVSANRTYRRLLSDLIYP